MSKEKLKEAIDLMKELWDYVDKAHNELNLDLFDTPLFEIPGKYFDMLLESNYTDEGCDWITWWCFECNFGENMLEAYDEDGNLICQTFDDLYECCKQYERV